MVEDVKRNYQKKGTKDAEHLHHKNKTKQGKKERLFVKLEAVVHPSNVIMIPYTKWKNLLVTGEENSTEIRA